MSSIGPSRRLPGSFRSSAEGVPDDQGTADGDVKRASLEAISSDVKTTTPSNQPAAEGYENTTWLAFRPRRFIRKAISRTFDTWSKSLRAKVDALHQQISEEYSHKSQDVDPEAAASATVRRSSSASWYGSRWISSLKSRTSKAFQTPVPPEEDLGGKISLSSFLTYRPSNRHKNCHILDVSIPSHTLSNIDLNEPSKTGDTKQRDFLKSPEAVTKAVFRSPLDGYGTEGRKGSAKMCSASSKRMIHHREAFIPHRTSFPLVKQHHAAEDKAEDEPGQIGGKSPVMGSREVQEAKRADRQRRYDEISSPKPKTEPSMLDQVSGETTSIAPNVEAAEAKDVCFNVHYCDVQQEPGILGEENAKPRFSPESSFLHTSKKIPEQCTAPSYVEGVEKPQVGLGAQDHLDNVRPVRIDTGPVGSEYWRTVNNIWDWGCAWHLNGIKAMGGTRELAWKPWVPYSNARSKCTPREQSTKASTKDRQNFFKTSASFDRQIEKVRMMEDDYQDDQKRNSDGALTSYTLKERKDQEGGTEFVDASGKVLYRVTKDAAAPFSELNIGRQKAVLEAPRPFDRQFGEVKSNFEDYREAVELWNSPVVKPCDVIKEGNGRPAEREATEVPPNECENISAASGSCRSYIAGGSLEQHRRAGSRDVFAVSEPDTSNICLVNRHKERDIPLDSAYGISFSDQMANSDGSDTVYETESLNDTSFLSLPETDELHESLPHENRYTSTSQSQSPNISTTDIHSALQTSAIEEMLRSSNLGWLDNDPYNQNRPFLNRSSSAISNSSTESCALKSISPKHGSATMPLMRPRQDSISIGLEQKDIVRESLRAISDENKSFTVSTPTSDLIHFSSQRRSSPFSVHSKIPTPTQPPVGSKRRSLTQISPRSSRGDRIALNMNEGPLRGASTAHRTIPPRFSTKGIGPGSGPYLPILSASLPSLKRGNESGQPIDAANSGLALSSTYVIGSETDSGSDADTEGSDTSLDRATSELLLKHSDYVLPDEAGIIPLVRMPKSMATRSSLSLRDYTASSMLTRSPSSSVRSSNRRRCKLEMRDLHSQVVPEAPHILSADRYSLQKHMQSTADEAQQANDSSSGTHSLEDVPKDSVQPLPGACDSDHSMPIPAIDDTRSLDPHFKECCSGNGTNGAQDVNPSHKDEGGTPKQEKDKNKQHRTSSNGSPNHSLEKAKWSPVRARRDFALGSEFCF